MTPLLRLESVSVRYGGLLALDEVTLEVPQGAIVGLIGPNGAGKTTLFDCVTGIVKPSSGRVFIVDEDITDYPVHRRPHLGIGRTFQRLELFGSLSVLENLVVAAESQSRRGGLLSDLLALPPTVEVRHEARERAKQVLAELGIESYADMEATDLPTGTARLVEVARARSTNPRLLLLDEPNAGLRGGETHELSGFLRRIRDCGTSILLVEHDIGFVLGLCEQVYVLDFGRLLAAGSPAEIRRNPVVQAAYLGEA